jgi:hypothetical protein
MQNRLRLVTSVGCGWFMVCWNATCVYDVNRKSLNVDLLWTVCWLRPRDRDGQHARPEPATVASNTGLGHTARIKTKHLTIWQCWPCANWAGYDGLLTGSSRASESSYFARSTISLQQCICKRERSRTEEKPSLSLHHKTISDTSVLGKKLKTLCNVPNSLVTPPSETLNTKF